jgi:putative copper export protein
MASKMFITKYVFRTLHMGSFAILAGNFFMDYLFGMRSQNISNEQRKLFKWINIIMGIVLILSGLISMIILIVDNKFMKTFSYEVWKKLLILKFFLTLSLTPLLERFIPLIYQTKSETESELVFKIRFFIILLLFFLSPFLRYYRESYLIKTRIKYN